MVELKEELILELIALKPKLDKPHLITAKEKEFIKIAYKEITGRNSGMACSICQLTLQIIENYLRIYESNVTVKKTWKKKK